MYMICDITLCFDGFSHYVDRYTQERLSEFVSALCEDGLNQSKLCDANPYVWERTVFFTKERR